MFRIDHNLLTCDKRKERSGGRTGWRVDLRHSVGMVGHRETGDCGDSDS